MLKHWFNPFSAISPSYGFDKSVDSIKLVVGKIILDACTGLIENAFDELSNSGEWCEYLEEDKIDDVYEGIDKFRKINVYEG